ncbi:hypothetical protein U0070_012943 [Myodes glareolus]|uniref:Uncharacterized protein n=1 Tax=Myodes glareolus TaxID=447135 RepID=A0AAW0JGC8_MYOGA
MTLSKTKQTQFPQKWKGCNETLGTELDRNFTVALVGRCRKEVVSLLTAEFPAKRLIFVSSEMHVEIYWKGSE